MECATRVELERVMRWTVLPWLIEYVYEDWSKIWRALASQKAMKFARERSCGERSCPPTRTRIPNLRQSGDTPCARSLATMLSFSLRDESANDPRMGRLVRHEG